MGNDYLKHLTSDIVLRNRNEISFCAFWNRTNKEINIHCSPYTTYNKRALFLGRSPRQRKASWKEKWLATKWLGLSTFRCRCCVVICLISTIPIYVSELMAARFTHAWTRGFVFLAGFTKRDSLFAGTNRSLTCAVYMVFHNSGFHDRKNCAIFHVFYIGQE